MSLSGHSLKWGSYPSVEVQPQPTGQPKHRYLWILTIGWFNVISRTLAGGGVLNFCRDRVGVFYTPMLNGLIEVFRIHRSLQADLKSAGITMILILPLISSSQNPLFRSLGSVPRAPIIIGITVTFMLHRFLARLKKLSIISFSFFFRSVIHLMTYSFCNVMAKGFRFMPLSLVRLRTFRLITWVS